MTYNDFFAIAEERGIDLLTIREMCPDPTAEVNEEMVDPVLAMLGAPSLKAILNTDAEIAVAVVAT